MTGILFDLDGTLLDTLDDLLDATNYALRFHGFPERTRQEIRRFVGNGSARLIRLSCPAGTPEETVQEVLATYKPYYTAHCQMKTAPYEHCTEALARLKENYALAIVSNKPDSAVKALCATFFPGIYALGETSDCPRKPAPDMLRKAMAAIGADRAVYVGDSEVDILTANNAGFPCLSVTWGFRDRDVLEEKGGKHFCSHPKDLENAIFDLMEGAAHGQ